MVLYRGSGRVPIKRKCHHVPLLTDPPQINNNKNIKQVRVMYTPFIGDEKRDIVEYTSLGARPVFHA